MSGSLVPQPQYRVDRPGTVRWSSPLRVSVEPEWSAVIERFSLDMASSIGWEVIVSDEGELRVARASDLSGEAYRLRVGETTTIEAASEAGVSCALTTLRQLGPDELWSVSTTAVERIDLPFVDIADAPRFAWRGVHLDVARHFFDVATVCRLIDQAAAHRLNVVHLHLNDDQGWRVEVPSWPRLSEVGSWRRSSPVGHEDAGVDDHETHGGFYDAHDLGTIREHARSRGVLIVPEIDLPGHAQAVLAAYPELGNADTPLEVWTRWGISEHVLNASEAALEFAEDVVTYVASLFPDSPVHIGGDECPTAEWESSVEARSAMIRHGFSDPRQLQGLYTSRIAGALRLAGHEVIAWDEVLDAEVADDTVICAWRSPSKGTEAARRGHDVIMAPMQFLYFDWLGSDREGEPVALAPVPFVTSWQKVYDFRVVPLDLEPELHHRIRGAQAQLWSEYIATRDHLDYMAFPRLCAFAEVAWGTAGTPEEFRPRLVEHLGRLRAMGVRYRELDPQ